MMTAMTEAENTSRFLANYSSSLWSYGATCIRITKNVSRMALRFGYKADITIFPKHVSVAVTGLENDDYALYTSAIGPVAVSYNANSLMSRLSWKVADGKMSLSEATSVMDKIKYLPKMSIWWVMVLVVLANASFCRLFGGDPMAMLIVAFATLIGYTVKNICLTNGVDLRITVIMASYISAIAGTAGYIFDCTGTPDIAIGTSVWYLIPGIPYINSVSDMLDGHYLCFFSRMMQAVILTGCIAAGLTLGFLTMNMNVF